jgi:hypothetical protein
MVKHKLHQSVNHNKALILPKRKLKYTTGQITPKHLLHHSINYTKVCITPQKVS